MHQQRSTFFIKKSCIFPSRVLYYTYYIFTKEIIVAKLQKSCKLLLLSYDRIASYVNKNI